MSHDWAYRPPLTAPDSRSPVEREIARSFVDDVGFGKPLSRRARQTRRTVETYLSAGVLPRYMQRLREIESEIALQRSALERTYKRLHDTCPDDREGFARKWLEIADRWCFDRVNRLIRDHNEWYPIEAQLPLDPRTGDYAAFCGRSYRRAELGAAWIVERFPAWPRSAACDSARD